MSELINRLISQSVLLTSMLICV